MLRPGILVSALLGLASYLAACAGAPQEKAEQTASAVGRFPEVAEKDLEAVGRRLMQQTYFAVPKEQLELAPDDVETLTLS